MLLIQVYVSVGWSPGANPMPVILETNQFSKMMGDGNDTSPAVGMVSQLPLQVNVGVKVAACAEETPMARVNTTPVSSPFI